QEIPGPVLVDEMMPVHRVDQEAAVYGRVRVSDALNVRFRLRIQDRDGGNRRHGPAADYRRREADLPGGAAGVKARYGNVCSVWPGELSAHPDVERVAAQVRGEVEVVGPILLEGHGRQQPRRARRQKEELVELHRFHKPLNRQYPPMRLVAAFRAGSSV